MKNRDMITGIIYVVLGAALFVAGQITDLGGISFRADRGHRYAGLRGHGQAGNDEACILLGVPHAGPLLDILHDSPQKILKPS